LWAFPVSSRARGQATDDWGSRWRSRAPYTSRWAVEDLSDSFRDGMEKRSSAIPKIPWAASRACWDVPRRNPEPRLPCSTGRASRIRITNARPSSSSGRKGLPRSPPRRMTAPPPSPGGLYDRWGCQGGCGETNLVMDASSPNALWFWPAWRDKSRNGCLAVRSLSGYVPKTESYLDLDPPEPVHVWV